MTDTPPPRRAGNRKTLGFMIGGFVLVAALAVVYFADGGSAGRGMAPPATTAPAAPIANPAEPAAPTAPVAPASTN